MYKTLDMYKTLAHHQPCLHSSYSLAGIVKSLNMLLPALEENPSQATFSAQTTFSAPSLYHLYTTGVTGVEVGLKWG